jgi:hypothetical protein
VEVLEAAQLSLERGYPVFIEELRSDSLTVNGSDRSRGVAGETAGQTPDLPARRIPASL